jgi:hypothetical protein
MVFCNVLELVLDNDEYYLDNHSLEHASIKYIHPLPINPSLWQAHTT